MRAREQLFADVGELPVLPDVVMQILKLDVADMDYFEKVGRLIARDPGAAAHLLVFANSARVRGVSEIRSIDEALVRLGARGVANMVTTMGLAKVFKPKKSFEKLLWVHSLEVAMAGRAIVRVLRDKNINGEEIYLAGLLHDIGRFVLFHEVTEEVSPASEATWENAALQLAAEVDVCGVDHTELGGYACERWGIAPSVRNVVRYHHTPLDHPEFEEKAQRYLEIVAAADQIMSHGALKSGSDLGALEPKEARNVITERIPLWAPVDPADLVEPMQDAARQARAAAVAIGIKL